MIYTYASIIPIFQRPVPPSRPATEPGPLCLSAWSDTRALKDDCRMYTQHTDTSTEAVTRLHYVCSHSLNKIQHSPHQSSLTLSRCLSLHLKCKPFSALNIIIIFMYFSDSAKKILTNGMKSGKWNTNEINSGQYHILFLLHEYFTFNSQRINLKQLKLVAHRYLIERIFFHKWAIAGLL